MQKLTSSTSSAPKPLWAQTQQVTLTLNFKNKDTDFAKQTTEAFKALEKKHAKKISSVTASNSRLIEEPLLPMLVVQDRASGEIITQILHFAELFANKKEVTPENVERLLILKGILEPQAGKALDLKEQQELDLAMGSSFLQDQLKNEDIAALNQYIWEKERIVELNLDPATINYRDCLLESYRGVEDPYESEIADLSYNQNPSDPSQVVRNIVFKNDDSQSGKAQQN